jgi:Holliday junction resolvase RusA-like endonuclease
LTLAAIGAYPHRPVLSKLIRSTEDALVMGALIGDDSQIIEVKARKVYSSAQGVRVKLDAVFP